MKEYSYFRFPFSVSGNNMCRLMNYYTCDPRCIRRKQIRFKEGQVSVVRFRAVDVKEIEE